MKFSHDSADVGDFSPISPAGEWHFVSGVVLVDSFTISTAYASYRMVFSTVRDPEGEGANSMQVAEIQFFGTGSSVEDADFDGDGDIDGADFLAWQEDLGTTGGASPADGDANGDGAVNDTDFGIWQGQYGSLPAGVAAAVPEPVSLALFGLMLVGTVVFLRRRT